MADHLTILGLESSCDDSAAAVVRVPVGPDLRAMVDRMKAGAAWGEATPEPAPPRAPLEGPGEILSSVVMGQADLHADFGGVVPEIAARAHAERLDICAERALQDAGMTMADLDAVAATAGPGLIGGGLPMVGVNHLEGHALTPRLTDGTAFPYLMLLASGGHCQILAVLGPGDHRRLGATIDDAPGEAFDKVAKMLGMGYPGGPEVEREALRGDPERFRLPRPLMDRPGSDMSFSGLKTAVRRQRDLLVEKQGGLTEQDRADLCAGFQAAAAELLAEKTRRAMAAFRPEAGDAPAIAVAGGVAANKTLRAGLEAAAAREGFAFLAPPMALCTDNAAMIAWAGAERLANGEVDGLDLIARPRWPLDRDAAAVLGSGRKGPKA